ncbi:MAG TPA: TIGR01777 family oxidoreductase, partial [Candidatus Deferrimicrobiaceae bacterium]
MRVLVSGSMGLVGAALCRVLVADRQEVGTLTRRGGGPGHVHWTPERGLLDDEALSSFEPDAVVHLAGESIAAGRWTPARKAAIRESRIAGTSLLDGALAAMRHPPKVFISASAIGYYGDRQGEPTDEVSASGTGFLAETCRAWEGATSAAAERGVRVVHLRTGMVLAAHGGALARMLPFFRLGLGGRLGDGRQYVSWIALPDLVASIRHMLVHPGISGPVNATSPFPATNAEFTRVLARVLSRPAVLPAPASLLRLAFGEMADALLLSGARVTPAR